MARGAQSAYDGRVANEPFGRSRAMIDRLGADIKRIAFVVSVVSFAASLFFYAYSLYLQVVLKRYVTLAVYALITAVSIALFAVYLSKRKPRGIEKKRKWAVAKEVLSWSVIGLRAIALGISAYQAFVLSVSTLDKVLTLGLAAWLLLQVLLELIEAFSIHYLDCFRYSLEVDKDNLGDAVSGMIKDYVKEKSVSFFESGFSRLTEKAVHYVPPEEEEKGPYEAKIAAEVESAYEEFQKKEEASKAKKAAERETARLERKEDLKAFLKRKKNKK